MGRGYEKVRLNTKYRGNANVAAGPRLLETVLYKLEVLEREMVRLSRQERRFDHLEAEMNKYGRLEKAERELIRVAQNVKELSTQLKQF